MVPSEHTAGLLDALGPEGLQRLVGAYGGVRVRVHSVPRPDSALAQALGGEVYRVLQERYAGEEIGVPRLALDAARRRHERVLAMAATGATQAQIARAEGIGLRWVQYLLARGADERQMTLDL
jgi:hypothetical protein